MATKKTATTPRSTPKTDNAAPKSEKIAAKPAVAEITHEMIAKRAFEIWCGKGRPLGGEAENWREAQEQLSAELGFADAPKPARGTRADARS